MVNELQSQEWAYLLDPCFQLANTKGAPLTGGHLEVFYHGTRTPYYCASDFNGTLHPFKIPLDSLGSNVVLADPNFSYDVYVYNKYGVLQMSRYDVNPGLGGSGGTSGEGGPAQHWIGKSASSVSVPKLTATALPLPENPDYEGDFATILNNTFVLAPGLYMVDCLVDFRQSSSDLTNKMGSIKFYTSDSSDPIEGQIFERNETGPDASGDSHQVQISFVRHVAEVDDDDALRFEMTSSNDLTYAKIDRLSIVKLEQGGGGTAYAAGYGIQIDGQVISTSGMMPEASAANFVDNSTYQVDIQNIYDTIAETSAMIPSGVATEQFVEDYTSGFITEDALDGYATQDWVVDQGYITSADIPPIPQDVITSGELATVSGDIVAQIPSLDGYATEQWVNEQGFITSADLPQSVPLVAGEGISIVDTSASTIISVDSAYSPGVSEEWVEDYVSNATSSFITSADIPDVPEDLVTSAELATVSGEIVSQIPDTSDMATKTWVGQQGYLSSIPEDIVTSGELATVSGDIMSQMPTPTSVAIEPTLQTGTKIADYVINGTSGELYAPQGGGSVTFPLEVSGSTNVYEARDGLTSGYANAGKLYLEQHAEEDEEPYTDTVSIQPGLVHVQYDGDGGYSLTNIRPNGITINNGGDVGQVNVNSIRDWYETYDAVADSATYWNSAYNAINSSASSWNDAAGMNEYPISAGPGMSIEDVDGVTVFSCTGGEVPDDVVTSGQLATVSGEIMNEIPDLTGYATQTWVSDGFMETSGIEFNSQDEISGYNGHPVMTVDSEKQWLTHDDTIAHVTNSAQYAFGVNVPVVAQAMGTDETVLWSGARTSACTLSEPANSFERIRIEKSIGTDTLSSTSKSNISFSDSVSSDNDVLLAIGRFTVSGTSVTVTRSKTIVFGTWSDTTTSPTVRNDWDWGKNIITKVVGIGRKEN